MQPRNGHCRSINNMAALKPGFYSLVLISLWLGSASGNVFAAGVPEIPGSARAPDSAGALADKMIGVDAWAKMDRPQIGDRAYEQRLALKPSAIPNISEQQATQIALKAVPGEVTHFGV